VEEVRKMNEHIELVEKWLEDNTSVSIEELKANADAALAAWLSARAAGVAGWAADAAYWVKRYEELTNDK